MLECKICGCKFNAVEERHYISRDNGKSGLAIVVQERKRIYIPCCETCEEDEE